MKSNAIVVVKDGRTLGVGAGQMNRIGSAELALKQAHAQGVTEGLVLASDGFFPFDDCVSLAAASGVEAIVQPGGSVRDEDSIRRPMNRVFRCCLPGCVISNIKLRISCPSVGLFFMDDFRAALCGKCGRE